MDSISCEKWNIVILADNEEHSKVYRLPISSTVGGVLDLWHRDEAVPGRWILASCEGIQLSEDMTVAAVGESVRGSKVVNLQIEECATLRIEVLGEDSRSLSLSVKLSMMPVDLHADVRQLISLPENRLFRLRADGDALRYDLSLAAQGVHANSVLEVDVAFELLLTEAWADSTKRRLLFSSEPLSNRQPGAAEQRFLLASARVDDSRALAHALPASVRCHSNLTLHNLQQRRVCTLTDTRLAQRTVWPHQSAFNLVSPPARPLLHCSGRPVSAGESCRAVGLQERGLVVASRMVSVALSNGRGAVVRLPHGATGADLRQAVETVEGRSVRLTVGGREVGEEELLETVGRQTVKASVAEERLEVRLGGRTLVWPCRGGLHFSQLVHEVAERSGEVWEEVRRVRFVCCGCGRRVSSEEEEWQEIPAACCRVRSLQLRVEVPKDCGTQAECWIDHKPLPTIETPASSCDVSIEATVTLTDVECQATVRMKNEECLTNKSCFKANGDSVVSNLTQHPPPIEPREFWIRNYTDLGSSQYTRCPSDAKLSLSPYPTVGEVKKEIAKFLEVETTDWRLVRDVAVVDEGVPVFLVYGYTSKYSDAVGRSRLHWHKKEEESYYDDEAQFVLPSGQKTIVEVQED